MKTAFDALTRQLGIGVFGIGGFAASAADYVIQNSKAAKPPLRLRAVCDPTWPDHSDRVEYLQSEGVELLNRPEDVLDRDDITGVWVPLPIDLHRPFAVEALQAGKYVLCEKPAAASVEDVDAMIAARDASGLDMMIGFQDVYDPTTAQVKRMILDGCIGRIHHTTVHACRPRGDGYFGRTDWAGRVQREGRWVLDSPASNAMAHYVNLALLMLGPSFSASATPVAIEAELYRSADIENYDTISARATTAEGADLLVLLTHACERDVWPTVHIVGEHGEITCTGLDWEIDGKDGKHTLHRPSRDAMYTEMMISWARVMSGRDLGDRLVATLEMARQHVLFICGASEAATVQDVDPAATGSAIDPRGENVVTIRGIEEVFAHCAENGLLLSESGQLSFARSPSRFDLRGYGPSTLAVGAEPIEVAADASGIGEAVDSSVEEIPR